MNLGLLKAYVQALGFGAGAGGGGTEVLRLRGGFPGTTSNTTGTQRDFAGVAGTIVKFSVWSTGNVLANTTVTLRINGVVSAATATILAGNSTADSGVIAVALLDTDYTTVDLVSSGAQDVGFRADINLT